MTDIRFIFITFLETPFTIYIIFIIRIFPSHNMGNSWSVVDDQSVRTNAASSRTVEFPLRLTANLEVICDVRNFIVE